MSHGILDPEGKYKNPLTGKNYSNQYRNMAKQFWAKLPVYAESKKIIDIINNNQVILVSAGTGAGKSVIVPKLALHTTDYKGKVVMTLPKTGITREAAERNAKALNVELGEEVGYQYRGSKLKNGKPSKSEKTRLLFSTDGSIVAQLINDPALKAYDIVIIDEAHERSIQIDILLLLMKKALKLNPNLKLIVMSATIDKDIFENYYKKDFKFAYVYVPGETLHPVDIKYLNNPIKEPETGPKKEFISVGVDIIINLIEKGEEGDICMFVNSMAEGREACQLLHQKIKTKGLSKVFCIEATGESVKDSEIGLLITSKNAFQKLNNGPYERKVVMATNAIESSLTIDDLKYVIDSGYAFVDSYEPTKMERRLLQERVSKAQAKQRTGRAGRTKPGICYRLYTKNEYEHFLDFPIVDIKKSDLTDDLLRFMKLPYVTDIGSLLKLLKELIEPPSEAFIKSAIYRLYALGAIDKMSSDGKLTPLGNMMAKFRKLDPILAKVVIRSYYYRAEYDTVSLAAMLNIADGRMNTFIKDMKNRKPKMGDPDFNKKDREYKTEKVKYDRAVKSYTSAYGDMMSLLKMYKQFREYGDGHTVEETKQWCHERYLKYEQLNRVKRSAQDIMREVQDIVFKDPKNNQEKKEQLEHVFVNKDELDLSNNKKKGGYFKLKGGMTATDESNIMKALLDGLFINLAKSVGNKYKNCFPFENTLAEVSRDSLLEITRDGPRFILYTELANILGRQKYNLVSKIPETSVRGLSDRQKNMVSQCFVKEKASYNKRPSPKRYNKRQSARKKPIGRKPYRKSASRKKSYKKRR
jgi:HrpA-like RNA helicase